MSQERRLPNEGVGENGIEEREPRPFENTIVALDVDGVLVRPTGYRQAVSLTIEYFANRLEVDSDEFMVDDRNRAFGRNMSYFEAEGIHDPWDVSAIIVSLMQLRRGGIDISPGEALDLIRTNSSPQSHPPEVLLEQLQVRSPQLTPEILDEITKTLSKTRDPFSNEVTSVFQEYVLGKDAFEETYGRSSRTGAEESLIKTKDQSLIDDSGRREIERISQNGGKVVIYTGRPGSPPSDAQREPFDGYAPEAELAVEKSKVRAIGIVSMGSMEWLGRVTGTPVEDLTKPNPTQALAAVLSALRGRTDVEVLMDAYTWGQTGEAPQEMQPFIQSKARLKLVVVEDSPAGVRAFIKARGIIESKGVDVELTAIGVHDGNFEKHMAFVRLGQGEELDVIDTNSKTKEGIIRYSYGIRGKGELED